MAKRKMANYSDPELDGEEEDEEWDPEEERIAPPPGISTCTAAAYRSVCTASRAKEYAVKYRVPPEYGLRAPTVDQRADDPPSGYAAIYTDQFQLGLRLPLPPFLISLLDYYQIALAQLHPNCIFPILGFIELCNTASVSPTVALFRHFYRLRANGKNTEGWYCLIGRKDSFQKTPVKILDREPPAVRTWKPSFLFFKTAPLPEDVTLVWNHSAVVDPQLADHERPSEQTVSRLLGNMKRSSKRRRAVTVKFEDFEEEEEERMPEADYSINLKAATEMQAKKSVKQKITSTESPNAARVLKRMAESRSTKDSVPSSKDMTPEQLAHYIQNCVSSLHHRLQGEKAESEKAVGSMEKSLKDKDSEITSLKAELSRLKGAKKQIASLQRDKDELEEVVAAMEHDFKDQNKEITSLKHQLKRSIEDRGPLLRVYTWKLFKTQAFARFFYNLTIPVKSLGSHEAAAMMRERYPGIAEEDLAGLEDPLAASKLDNLFFDMIQDDAFEFPLLDHLLSLKEVPSSSRLKAVDVDEDRDALVPPSPPRVRG